MERDDEVIKSYDRAIEINPENAEAWDSSGWALGTLSRYDYFSKK
ncbi:hypothetical protein [Methanocalculus sp. MSAO_Arc2]